CTRRKLLPGMCDASLLSAASNFLYEINWHSIKNRFLMRAKNIGWPLYARCFLPTSFRDAQVMGYCRLADRKLASALVAVWKLRDDLSRKRQIIQSRRQVSDRQLCACFRRTPAAVPFSPAAKPIGESW